MSLGDSSAAYLVTFSGIAVNLIACSAVSLARAPMRAHTHAAHAARNVSRETMTGPVKHTRFTVKCYILRTLDRLIGCHEHNHTTIQHSHANGLA